MIIRSNITRLFFLWPALKDLVYRLKPKTIPELKEAIPDKFSDINGEMCQVVCRDIADRIVLNMKRRHAHVKYFVVLMWR